MPRVIHFEIHAEDPERAIRFYRQVFGWEFTRWGGAQEYWIIRTGEADQPGIDGGLIRRRGALDSGAVNAYVCTVAVDSLARYLNRVALSGGHQVVDTMAIAGVGWLAYCKDTEGNIFGMLEADEHAR